MDPGTINHETTNYVFQVRLQDGSLLLMLTHKQSQSKEVEFEKSFAYE